MLTLKNGATPAEQHPASESQATASAVFAPINSTPPLNNIFVASNHSSYHSTQMTNIGKSKHAKSCNAIPCAPIILHYDVISTPQFCVAMRVEESRSIPKELATQVLRLQGQHKRPLSTEYFFVAQGSDKATQCEIELAPSNPEHMQSNVLYLLPKKNTTDEIECQTCTITGSHSEISYRINTLILRASDFGNFNDTYTNLIACLTHNRPNLENLSHSDQYVLLNITETKGFTHQNLRANTYPMVRAHGWLHPTETKGDYNDPCVVYFFTFEGQKLQDPLKGSTYSHSTSQGSFALSPPNTFNLPDVANDFSKTFGFYSLVYCASKNRMAITKHYVLSESARKQFNHIWKNFSVNGYGKTCSYQEVIDFFTPYQDTEQREESDLCHVIHDLLELQPYNERSQYAPSQQSHETSSLVTNSLFTPLPSPPSNNTTLLTETVLSKIKQDCHKLMQTQKQEYDASSWFSKQMSRYPLKHDLLNTFLALFDGSQPHKNIAATRGSHPWLRQVRDTTFHVVANRNNMTVDKLKQYVDNNRTSVFLASINSAIQSNHTSSLNP